jgi:hypothetical protein
MSDRIEPTMPRTMSFLADHKGNTVQIGSDISAETAIEKMGEGYPITLFVYRLQATKIIAEKQQS